jgi:P27 family predicted phage terminase small subunit
MAGGIAPNAPTPTALKLLRGNPGKRPINKDEPKPRIGLPNPPMHLRDYPLAVKNWKKEGGLLLRLGVMTEADWGALAVRCYLYSEMVQMMNDIKRFGRIDEKGRTNPLVNQLESAMSEYRRVGVLLGLDPSSRTRIKVTKGDKQGAFDEFF